MKHGKVNIPVQRQAAKKLFKDRVERLQTGSTAEQLVDCPGCGVPVLVSHIFAKCPTCGSIVQAEVRS
jgi:rubrerythrin